MRDVALSAAGFLAGTWAMFAPAVLGYEGAAAAADRILGPTAAAAAWISATAVSRSVRWVALPIGIAFVLLGLLLQPSPGRIVHGLVTGGVLIGFALAQSAIPAREYGGGWAALLPHRRRS